MQTLSAGFSRALPEPIGGIACWALTAFWLLLLARVILSFLPLFGVRVPAGGPTAMITPALEAATDPFLRPLRNVMQPVRLGGMGLDLSILVAFVIVNVLQIALRC